TVYVDPESRWQRLEAALKAGGRSPVSMRGWNHPGEKSNPIEVLRAFLSPQEGGSDTGHRQDEALFQLVPWQYLPPIAQQLQGEPGMRLKPMFATPFNYFYTRPRMPRELLLAWLPGLEEGTTRGDTSGKAYATPGKASELILRERLPRDLVLRGKFDEATT